MVQNLPNFPAQMLTPTQKLDKQVAEQLQEASMSRCMLNACHWERCLNPAGLLPARICDELNSLPAPVLHGLVQDTPLCVISALIWQLAAVPAVWGRDRNKDFDVVEDIDRGMPGAARIGYPASPGCVKCSKSEQGGSVTGAFASFCHERGNTFASWKLLCNPLPNSLEHYQYLWPSESKVLRVPYSPYVWQEAPYLPCNCRLTGPAESVSLTHLGHTDKGLSRLFLWWVWNQGLPALQQRLKPRVRQAEPAWNKR
ncbi:TPA: hypothetical protein ACH3X1_001233 [Trebouxia sp. C0004]